MIILYLLLLINTKYFFLKNVGNQTLLVIFDFDFIDKKDHPKICHHLLLLLNTK